jgi:hypothetical protein
MVGSLTSQRLFFDVFDHSYASGRSFCGKSPRFDRVSWLCSPSRRCKWKMDNQNVEKKKVFLLNFNSMQLKVYNLFFNQKIIWIYRSFRILIHMFLIMWYIFSRKKTGFNVFEKGRLPRRPSYDHQLIQIGMSCGKNFQKYLFWSCLQFMYLYHMAASWC